MANNIATVRRRRREEPKLVSTSRTGTVQVDASLPSANSKSNKTTSMSSHSDHSLVSLLLVAIWIVAISLFLLINYAVDDTECWPLVLAKPSLRNMWRFVHALSSMLFGGTIILSTLVEWIVVSSKRISMYIFWFTHVPTTLDAALVLPALTGCIISGVAQAIQDYGSLRDDAPMYIRAGALHVLLTFGLWWAVTDLSTLQMAQRALEQLELASNGVDNDKLNDTAVPRVFYLRRWSNVGSCIFVISLYFLMAFKPGQSSSVE